jgi:Fic family protein
MSIFEWLKSRGYDYTWDVKLGSLKPDIVAFNGREIVVIESKRADLKSTIARCLQYLKEANRVYILTTKRTSIGQLKRHGIGLIESNHDTKLVVEASYFPMDKKKFDIILEALKKKSLVGGSENNFKQRIVEILRQHTEGLTIVDIAKILGAHRHTSAKYVSKLIKEGSIIQREVGPAKLCYLKNEGEKSEK